MSLTIIRLSRFPQINGTILQRLASTRPYEPPSKIILTDDESTFVAWHPKTEYPYECTRPLPEVIVEETDTVLKTQLTPQVMEVFNKKTPEQARQELMNITYTTKHRWFPRSTKRVKTTTPMDRKYL